MAAERHLGQIARAQGVSVEMRDLRLTAEPRLELPFQRSALVRRILVSASLRLMEA